MKISKRTAGALGACILLSAGAAAPSAGQQQQAPCSAPEHRQFDFWIGNWEVSANGQKAGENTIRSTMAGCVLHESYTAVSGYVGESFNVYDASRGVWHQTWVDNTGLLLTIEGRYQDGRMVLEGETTGADGSVTQQRITWSLVDGDRNRVRQHWETRPEGGEWSTAFDGLYERTSG